MKKLTSTPAAIAQLVKEYPTKNPSEIAKMAKGLGYTAVSTSIVKTIIAKLPRGKYFRPARQNRFNECDPSRLASRRLREAANRLLESRSRQSLLSPLRGRDKREGAVSQGFPPLYINLPPLRG